MPELPEVETIVRDLQRLTPGSRIERATVHRPDLIRGDPEEFRRSLEGRRIERVSRRAKTIAIAMDANHLLINLGMTGRILVIRRDDPDPPYTGVRLDLDDGRKLVYHDVRRFGRLTVASDQVWETRSTSLGFEPLSDEFTPELLFRLSRGSRMAVKPWLMDQKRIVGVGNIYASEALFRAGVSPRKAARRLTRREATALHAAIRDVLQEAIDFRGTTLLDYRDAAGERGGFAARLRVYDRDGRPCVTCGSPIRRIVQGGRSTFFCPHCQR